MRRKGLHVAAALAVPGVMAGLGAPWGPMLVGAGAALGVAADVARAYVPAFRGVITRVFGRLLRAEEQPPPGTVRLNGATCVLVGAALTALLVPLATAATAVALTLTADAAAALVGRRLGRHRWPGTRRTVEGTAAFVGAGLAGGAALAACGAPVGFPVAAAGVAAAAAAEVPDLALDDNIRLPLAAAAAMTLTGMLG